MHGRLGTQQLLSVTNRCYDGPELLGHHLSTFDLVAVHPCRGVSGYALSFGLTDGTLVPSHGLSYPMPFDRAGDDPRLAVAWSAYGIFGGGHGCVSTFDLWRRIGVAGYLLHYVLSFYRWHTGAIARSRLSDAFRSCRRSSFYWPVHGPASFSVLVVSCSWCQEGLYYAPRLAWG